MSRENSPAESSPAEKLPSAEEVFSGTAQATLSDVLSDLAQGVPGDSSILGYSLPEGSENVDLPDDDNLSKRFQVRGWLQGLGVFGYVFCPSRLSNTRVERLRSRSHQKKDKMCGLLWCRVRPVTCLGPSPHPFSTFLRLNRLVWFCPPAVLAL